MRITFVNANQINDANHRRSLVGFALVCFSFRVNKGVPMDEN
jgi:hypothetical protein